jgi:hypothetical protein
VRASITLPAGHLEIHAGTRGVTLTAPVPAEPYLTLPDLATVEALISALVRARRAIVLRQAAERPRDETKGAA